jgi:phosphoribosyl-ATP pyrophosphohydrolase
MSETQFTINCWTNDIGIKPAKMSILTRANEEMAELLNAGAKDDAHDVREEMADVVICLMVAAQTWGFNLDVEISRKMKINRTRTWIIDETTGQAHHVKSTTGEK